MSAALTNWVVLKRVQLRVRSMVRAECTDAALRMRVCSLRSATLILVGPEHVPLSDLGVASRRQTVARLSPRWPTQCLCTAHYLQRRS